MKHKGRSHDRQKAVAIIEKLERDGLLTIVRKPKRVGRKGRQS